MTHRQIIVNLPCSHLGRSRAFFEALGYAVDPQFTGEQAVSLILGENLRAMLLAQDFARTLTAKPLVDARAAIEGWVCLSCDSREAVDALIASARAAGGRVPGEAQDFGFMYGQGFEDLDGHHWELVHLSGTPPQA